MGKQPALSLLLCVAALPALAADKTYFINNSGVTVTLQSGSLDFSRRPEDRFQGIQVSFINSAGVMQVLKLDDKSPEFSVPAGAGICVEAQQSDVTACGQFRIFHVLTHAFMGTLIYQRPATTSASPALPPGQMQGRLTGDDSGPAGGAFHSAVPGMVITLNASVPHH